MPLGIKLGSKHEIITIFGTESLYTCFGVYELPTTLIDKETYYILKSAGDNGVRFTLHAPHPFNSNVDIALSDSRLRKEAVNVVKSAINIAEGLPAEALVIHCGLTNSYNGTQRKKDLKSKRDTEDALETAKKSLLELSEYTKDAGICLTIENDAALPGIDADNDEMRFSFGALCTTPDSIAYMLDGLTNIGFTFDIGHSYATANHLKRKPYDFMRAIINVVGINRIKNVHLTDIAGSVDYHVAVGEGTINFNKVFSCLEGYNGPMIVENFPPDIYKSLEKIHYLYSSSLDKRDRFDITNAKRFCVEMGWAV